MQSSTEPPTENQNLLRACSRNHEDQKLVARELQEIARKLLTKLVDPLNQCSGTLHSTRFWRRYVSYWMVNFIDAVFVEWLDLMSDTPNEKNTQNYDPKLIQRATIRMSELLEVSQQSAWRLQLKHDIQSYMNGDPPPLLNDYQGNTSEMGLSTRPNAQQKTNLLGTNFLRQQKFVLSTTYLPRRYELALGMMLGVVPIRWQDRLDENVLFSSESRLEVRRSIDRGNGQTFSSVVMALLPSYLPWTTVEGMKFLHRDYEESGRAPSVIFTANLHFSSDTFAFWSALASERGAKVIVSQHGGLNGQGYIPTRDEEIERSEFDGYLHWGWSNTEKSVKIPAQITLGRRHQIQARGQRQILLMCDATFRFKRRFWSDSGRYRDHLRETFCGIPVASRSDVVVRLHRDHARYDESHILFWENHFPEAEIDAGTKSIKKLYRRSRLVVCTTLGTTEIECFAQNQPVLLSLDKTLHRVRQEFARVLGKLESVGVVHFSTESLASFLNQNLVSIESWWASSAVQSVVDEYLNAYGATSKRPLRDYRDVIVGLSRN